MFLPLSLAVGFAMIASFLLSQTLVPVLSTVAAETTLVLDEIRLEEVMEEGAHLRDNATGFNNSAIATSAASTGS